MAIVAILIALWLLAIGGAILIELLRVAIALFVMPIVWLVLVTAAAVVGTARLFAPLGQIGRARP